MAVICGIAVYSRAAEPRVALAGHIPPQVATAALLQRASADEPVQLSLVVKLDQTLLDQTLEQLYGRNAPARKHFLSSSEFAQKFELADKRDQLKNFAKANGLTIDSDEDNDQSMVVKVSGSAGAVEQVFNIQLNRYRTQDGRLFRANNTEPQIPASLSPHLGAVIGLSNISGFAHPHIQRLPAQARSPSISGGTGLGGTLAPSDIKTIYGLNSTALNGSGQKLALFELDGYHASDITAYETMFGLSNVPLTFVGVDGATNNPSNGNGTDEVTLDIELAIALAPGLSKLLVYGGPNTGQGVLDTYDKIATDNSASVVSTSWGLNEPDSGVSFLNAESQIFQRMATQGQTIFAASGDNGAYDDGTSVTVDDPASQPYVTGVGGTSLAGTLLAPVETVWNSCGVRKCLQNQGGSSGGGVSIQWPIPSYQVDVAGLASQTFRNVPDVALNADPASGYEIIVLGVPAAVGGTSAAAPLWAALAAMVNQQRASSGSSALGFANPTLYALATSTSAALLFTDVTSGSNGFYNAASGYDNTTGWGSFKGTSLINTVSVAGPPLPTLANLYAYPNPWDARKTSSRQIKFANNPYGQDSNLPDGTMIKIFTLSGFWVKTLIVENRTAVWQDLTNDAGERVASGLYFYVATSGSNQARGTIAIIK